MDDRLIFLDVDGVLNSHAWFKKFNEKHGRNASIAGDRDGKGPSEHIDPKTVDLTVTESSDGNNIGHIFKGIYELGEKTRRVCLARDGGERPTEFFSAAASGHMLVTYEKVEEE